MAKYYYCFVIVNLVFTVNSNPLLQTLQEITYPTNVVYRREFPITFREPVNTNSIITQIANNWLNQRIQQTQQINPLLQSRIYNRNIQPNYELISRLLGNNAIGIPQAVQRVPNFVYHIIVPTDVLKVNNTNCCGCSCCKEKTKNYDQEDKELSNTELKRTHLIERPPRRKVNDWEFCKRSNRDCDPNYEICEKISQPTKGHEEFSKNSVDGKIFEEGDTYNNKKEMRKHIQSGRINYDREDGVIKNSEGSIRVNGYSEPNNVENIKMYSPSGNNNWQKHTHILKKHEDVDYNYIKPQKIANEHHKPGKTSKVINNIDNIQEQNAEKSKRKMKSKPKVIEEFTKEVNRMDSNISFQSKSGKSRDTEIKNLRKPSNKQNNSEQNNAKKVQDNIKVTPEIALEEKVPADVYNNRIEGNNKPNNNEDNIIKEFKNKFPGIPEEVARKLLSYLKRKLRPTTQRPPANTLRESYHEDFSRTRPYVPRYPEHNFPMAHLRYQYPLGSMPYRRPPSHSQNYYRYPPNRGQFEPRRQSFRKKKTQNRNKERSKVSKENNSPIVDTENKINSNEKFVLHNQSSNSNISNVDKFTEAKLKINEPRHDNEIELSENNELDFTQKLTNNPSTEFDSKDEIKPFTVENVNEQVSKAKDLSPELGKNDTLSNLDKNGLFYTEASTETVPFDTKEEVKTIPEDQAKMNYKIEPVTHQTMSNNQNISPVTERIEQHEQIETATENYETNAMKPSTMNIEEEELSFKTPPGLESPNFITRRVNRPQEERVITNGNNFAHPIFDVSPNYEENVLNQLKFVKPETEERKVNKHEIPENNNIETIYARSKVVKYSSASSIDDYSEEDGDRDKILPIYDALETSTVNYYKEQHSTKGDAAIIFAKSIPYPDYY